MKQKVITVETMRDSVMHTCLSRGTITDVNILRIFAKACMEIIEYYEVDRLQVPLIKVDVCTDKITVGFYSIKVIIDEEKEKEIKKDKKDNWVTHKERQENLYQEIRGCVTANRFNVRELEVMDKRNHILEYDWNCKLYDCAVYIYQDSYIISTLKEIDNEEEL